MGEIIKAASAISDPKEAVRYLQNNGSHPSFRILARYWVQHNPFKLPEGTPPYKPTAESDDPWVDGLYQRVKTLYIFEEHGSLQFSKPAQRENKYIDFIRDFTDDDVKLLEWVKDGIFPGHLTRDIIKQAFHP